MHHQFVEIKKLEFLGAIILREGAGYAHIQQFLEFALSFLPQMSFVN